MGGQHVGVEGGGDDGSVLPDDGDGGLDDVDLVCGEGGHGDDGVDVGDGVFGGDVRRGGLLIIAYFLSFFLISCRVSFGFFFLGLLIVAEELSSVCRYTVYF
jgi:hypothetical protein